MTLSRPRRIATGIAAGAIVLCAALLGASFRDDNPGVAVASEAREVIPVPEFDEDELNEATEDSEATEDTEDEGADSADSVTTTDEPAEEEPEDDEALSDPVRVIEEDDLPEDSVTDTDSSSDAADDGNAASDDEDADPDATDSDAGGEEAPAGEDTATDTPDDAAATEEDDAAEEAATEDDSVPGASTVESAADADAAQDSTPPAAADPPAAPPVATGGLGTGGGVSDAECGLDRLVIYAGAPVGGVAGRIRTALANAGFGAGCPAPVTVLAANCPLQFSGVLPAGSGYSPGQSFVASSANVDRASMTAILGEIGYTGAGINILPFGFAQADKPGERWMAIFVPPSFAGWEGLAGRAGLSPTSQSLCGPTGRVGG